MKKILTVVLISILFLNGIGLVPALADNPIIRVAILKDVATFVVSARGQYHIVDLNNNEVLLSGRRLKRSKVTILRSGITIGKNYFKTDKLRIATRKDVTVYSKNKKGRFREAVDINLVKNETFLVINRLNVESYVRGVLYHEISDKWPIEATKAQAVATRTYALYKIQENKKELFDVTSDIYSQVYGGQTAERFRTDMAANSTKGQVLLYDGKIVPAFFHANSGGHTENADQVWGINTPPLKGVASPYSEGMPHYVWKKNFQSREIQKKLQDGGINVGYIKNITVAERTESGRIRDLIVESRKGKKTRISGKRFRQIIGPNSIKSNMYDIKMQGYFFDVMGRGWGHGVGMCQWGAYNMAKNRFAYKDILTFYYPGSKIVKVK